MSNAATTLSALPENIKTSKVVNGRTIVGLAWAHFADNGEVVFCWSAYEDALLHGDSARVLVGRRYESSMENAAKAAADYRPEA